MSIRRALLAASSALLLTLAIPASAETAPSEDYVANIRQQVAFLDAASRLAGQRSGSEELRAHARAEAAQQGHAADDLRLWDTGRVLSSFGPSMLVATNEIETVTDAPDKIMTGRSAAVDPAPTVEWSRPEPGVAMVSPGTLVMPQLEKLRGEAFDELYKTTQTIALKELAGFYEAYGMTGKDVTLKAMAQRELPLVKQRLAELEAL